MFHRPATSSNNRAAPRVAVWGNVSMTIEGGGSFEGRLRDLSLTGLCVVTSEPIPIGSKVTVLIPLVEELPPVEVGGEAVWTVTERTAGVEEYVTGYHVVDPSEDLIKRLRTFIDRRIWSTLDCLGRLPFLYDFNDIERLSLSGYCLSFDLSSGEELHPRDMEGGIAMIHRGKMTVETHDGDGKVLTRQAFRDGEIVGSPAADWDGATGMRRWIAEGSAKVVVIPREGLRHIESTQPRVAIKLLSAYCSMLERKLAQATGGVVTATD